MGDVLDLNNLSIEVRPRPAWEAVDLGCLMAQRWWWPLVKIWFVLSFPIWFILAFLPLDYLWLQALIIWWLKPIFERGLLYFLSRAVFNDHLTTKDVVKSTLRLAARQWFPSLTWRRLSLSRSMNLAVIQLENLSGAARSKRLRVLHREDSKPAAWLTIIGIHIESFLTIAVYLLFVSMIPATVEFDMAEYSSEYFTGDTNRMFWLVNNGLAYLAALCVGPYYVASGFSLYLNRRVKLEAWDLDIAFRRIMEKRIKHLGSGKVAPSDQHLPNKEVVDKKASKEKTPQKLPSSSDHTFLMIFATSMTTFITSAALIALLMTPADYVLANVINNHNNTSEIYHDKGTKPIEEENKKYKNFDQAMIVSSESHVTPQMAKYTINYIESGDAFHKKETLKYPSFSWFDLDAVENLNDSQKNILPLWVATLLELFFWGLIVFGVGYIIYRYRNWLSQFVGYSTEKIQKKSRPSVLFGMNISSQTLPKNLQQDARELCENGDFREGLALLYRGCLSYLVSTGYELNESFTEMECLMFVQQLQTSISQPVNDPSSDSAEPSSYFCSNIKSLPAPSLRYFSELTRVWRNLAYAHKNPTQKEAQALCDDWSELWLTASARDSVLQENADEK